MPYEPTPVKTERAGEAPEANPPMHPRERMKVIEDAVTVALNPDATDAEREAARQKLAALEEGGG